MRGYFVVKHSETRFTILGLPILLISAVLDAFDRDIDCMSIFNRPPDKLADFERGRRQFSAVLGRLTKCN